MKGFFITFEGGEGAGKSTLMERIFEDLSTNGFSVIKTRAPGGTKVGEAIRHLLLSKENMSLVPRSELLLFLADRAQHVEEVIKPALNQQKIVLCDRFNDSTIAYQGGARGFDDELVRGLCSFACDNLQPHLTIYLDLDPKIGFKRIKADGVHKDRIESETIDFHRKIREAFHKIAKKDTKRFKMIDASLSRDEVFKQAMQLINDLL